MKKKLVIVAVVLLIAVFIYVKFVQPNMVPRVSVEAYEAEGGKVTLRMNGSVYTLDSSASGLSTGGKYSIEFVNTGSPQTSMLKLKEGNTVVQQCSVADGLSNFSYSGIFR